jgi:antitoxin component YwqK of YwqJK toxin-antitoxin module
LWKVNNVDGKEQGEGTYYHKNGEIYKIENYKDGVLIED